VGGGIEYKNNQIIAPPHLNRKLLYIQNISHFVGKNVHYLNFIAPEDNDTKKAIFD